MDLHLVLEKLRDYETVIDTMHCGLVAEDLNGTVVFANQRLLDWLGYGREEVEGHPIENLLPPEIRDLVRQDMDAAMPKGKHRGYRGPHNR